ncbi:zinc finger MYM-type protein 1-like [Oryza brachyantha]|uniref:zinc finger MYM-type protein 1-like n=1 Tax=Oryza brachyantha TaxID=4533 RepID=UPI001ADC0747|nr:zinc finger MYM-type protein 1-like [Oryza brachyantha]
MVRRKYLDRGPSHPCISKYPITVIGGKDRKFNPKWDPTNKAAGYDAFVTTGWSSWNKKFGLRNHVGDINSAHNQAKRDCNALLSQDQHIYVSLKRQCDADKIAYYTRLNGSVDVARVLLKQGLPFRGQDESESSLNKGNFKEFHAYTAQQNPALGKVTAHNAPGNNLMVSSEIQKDIIHCFAAEILRSILDEIGHDVFCLLVDESRDVSCKEQMAVVLRFVDKQGSIQERFVGLVHVKETTSAYLKSSIDALFVKYNLSLKQLRGQGYDGASNMRGEFNGLQSLIMRENGSAYYIHCFAHKLQLVIVAIVKKYKGIGNFFDMISVLLNVMGAPSKRRDMIRDINYELVQKALGCGLLETGTRLNQELSLQRPGDTRWSSHYKTLKSLVDLFPTAMKVLEYVEEGDREDKNRSQAFGLQVYFQSFDFVFYLHLMLTVLTITNSLSLILQRKDQDIVNAVACKWEKTVNPKKPRQRTGITNQHHYEVECFNDILDWLLQELDGRFNEKTSNLLVYTAALSPRDSFNGFNLEHLMSMAKLYPNDFDEGQLRDLRHHLRLYIDDVQADERFSHIETICDLSQKMVETRKHICYPLVYHLLKLALVLPIATATVERCFSAMKTVKTGLRNRMGNKYLSDSLICYVEKAELNKVTNDVVIGRFQDYKRRRIDD